MKKGRELKPSPKPQQATSGLEPFMEAMTAARLSWVSPLAAEQFEGFPKPADYQRLMAAYSARQVG